MEQIPQPNLEPAGEAGDKHLRHFASNTSPVLELLKNNRVFIGLVLCFFILGFSLGYVMGGSLSADNKNDDLIYDLDSKIITQRTVVAKGELADLTKDGLVLMPIGITDQEKELNKYDISIDSETDVYLQIIDSDSEENIAAQKVTVDKLLAGDIVNVIMSVQSDGSSRTTTVSATRSK